MTSKKDGNRWAGMEGREEPVPGHRLDSGRRFRLDQHLPCPHCGKYPTKDGREPK